jgi:hypothetical protein
VEYNSLKVRILFKNLLLNKIIMSRRTAPTAGRQQQRTPQPSIKSSQVFAPQPTREQTQYQQMNAKKQLQQQQLQQTKNYQQDYNEEYSEKQNVSGITKMTIAQAITLITLRLGSVETKLNREFNSNINNIDEETLVNVSNRLDSLESKINLSSSTDYKQQIDNLTQAVIQSKNFSNTLMKENKELKTQLTNLKKEMTDVKQLIENVKNIATSNENKIFQMLNVSTNFQLDEKFNSDEQNELKTDNETEFNLSDSEHSILETDIRKTLEENNKNDENEELQITQIENL